MTIWQYLTYIQPNDSTIFDLSNLPDGIDKRTLQEGMCLIYGNCELSVPYEQLDQSIRTICDIHSREVSRMYTLSKAGYNPFITTEGSSDSAKDSRIDRTNNTTGSYNDSSNGTENIDNTGNRTTDVTTHDEGTDTSYGSETTGTSQHEVDGISAFNASGFSNASEKTIDGDSNTSTSVDRETNNDGTKNTVENSTNNTYKVFNTDKQGGSKTDVTGNETGESNEHNTYSGRTINNMDLYTKEWEALQLSFYHWLIDLIASHILLAVY